MAVNEDMPEQTDSAANIVWRRIQKMNTTTGVGNQGPQGTTGPQGPKGDKGEKGDPGKDGDPGIKGDPGETGISAFEAAKLNGFKGNESEWLESLVGPEGGRGEIGPQGLKGDQGIPGEQGIQGPKGNTGSKGEKGDIGPQGIQGEMGPQGLKGDTGAKGDTGSAANVQYENGIVALPALLLGGSVNVTVPLSGSFPNTIYQYKIRTLAGVNVLSMLSFTEVSRTVNSVTVKAQANGLASVAGLLLIDAYKN